MSYKIYAKVNIEFLISPWRDMMSQEKPEVLVLSFCERLKLQHSNFVQQRDLAINNFNQLVGAIHACELMIKQFEEVENHLISKDMAVMDVLKVDGLS
jgi:hypothetical protein